MMLLTTTAGPGITAPGNTDGAGFPCESTGFAIRVDEVKGAADVPWLLQCRAVGWVRGVSPSREKCGDVKIVPDTGQSAIGGVDVFATKSPRGYVEIRDGLSLTKGRMVR